MAVTATYGRTVQSFKESEIERSSTVDKTKTHHIEYGKIIEVDLLTSRVKVKRQNGQELRGGTVDGEVNQRFFPLITPMATIHLLYGPLVEGLSVRIHWIGDLEPESLVVVDLIRGEGELVKQDYAMAEQERGFSMPL